jgi:small conductance mechanosensitive channel
MNDILGMIAGYSSQLVYFAEILLLFVVLLIANSLLTLVFKRLIARVAVANKIRLVTLRRNVRIVLILMWMLAFLLIAGYDAYGLYQGIDLYDRFFDLILSLPENFGRVVAVKVFTIIATVMIAYFIARMLSTLLLRMMQRARAFEQIRANDASIELFFKTLVSIEKITISILVFLVMAKVFSLPESIQAYLLKGLIIYLIISIGMLIVRAIAAIVDSLDGLSRRYSRPDNFLRFYDRLRSLVPLLRRTLEYIIYVTIATLVFTQLSGIASLAVYGPRLVQVIGVFFLGRVVIEVFNLLIDSRMGPVEGASEAEEQQRLTFVPLIKSIASYLVYALAFVLILKALHIDPTPILASAGLLGLVVGLAAQPLINDFISGFFILFENLYMVNDYIETGSTRGTVEGIDIRTTRIRGGDGELHIIRNGQIGEVINYSKDYVFAVLLVGVAYESDLHHVYRVMRSTAEELQREDPRIVNPVELMGLDQFGESELSIRHVIRVRPGCHLSVAREMRTRIKLAFDREGIEIPYARQVVIFKNLESDLQ